MVDATRNQILTETGDGTPMGELLRRYWWPIAGQSELDETATKPVRLLGEDLVLYKDLSGTCGLVDRHCPHRRADLSYGYVEECGLRCNYHGWLYDETGRCIAQPYEDMAHPEVNLKAKIRVKAYPIEAKGGILWAYLGPQPAPLLPDWEFFHWKNGFVQIVLSDIPCNWLQCQENSIDPVHHEWMHGNWGVRLAGKMGPPAPTHHKLDFAEFEYGFRYMRVRGDDDETSDLWTIGRVCLWPNALFTGTHIEWRVPIDDSNTLSISWFFNRVPSASEPFVQNSIPAWNGPIKDEATGRWITSHIMNQDFVAWTGQGAIADRTRENLGSSDRGIAMIRRRLFEDIDAVARGEDPKAVIRDPALNRCIMLPVAEREKVLGDPANGRSPPRRFIFQAGQPDSVRAAYEQAMGLGKGTSSAAPKP
jgi:5,5'-dehydrodivanillate O-demethylase oxygenase subunit